MQVQAQLPAVTTAFPRNTYWPAVPQTDKGSGGAKKSGPGAIGADNDVRCEQRLEVSRGGYEEPVGRKHR